MGHLRDVDLGGLELSGERLLLRRWRDSDAARVHAVMQDPSMAQFLALPQPYTFEDARQFVTRIGHEGRDEGSGLGCAVVERESQRVIGACALRFTDEPAVGYWTAPDARGHGYGAELTRVLAQFGHGLGRDRIRLDCDVRNVASIATALAAGFRFEGVSRGAVTSPGGGDVAPYVGDLARFGRVADDPAEPVPPAYPRLPAGGLTDGVLALRVLHAEDAAALHETDDAESIRWSFTGRPETAEVSARIAARAGLEWLVGGTARAAMVDVATGRFAGDLSLRRSGPPQVGGIGYVVHPQFRGRGYTSRALRLISRWAFEQCDIARLELGAKTENIASQRAAASAGFEPDGIRRVRLRNADGSFDDEVRFALINPRYAR